MEEQTERPGFSKYTSADLQKKEDLWEKVIDGILITTIVAEFIAVPIYSAYTLRHSMDQLQDSTYVERNK